MMMKLFPLVALSLPLTVAAAEIDFDDYFDDMPGQRFNPWQVLSSATTNEATAAGWTTDTWNTIGSADVEDLPWHGLSPEQQTAIRAIGFTTEEQWNCYMNHYNGFSWQNLIDSDRNLVAIMATLGWTQEMWDADDGQEPPSMDKDWTDLTDEEQWAAAEICWFPDAWEEIPLAEMTDIPMPYPKFRFTPWSKLDSLQQSLATTAGWTEQSWDNPGTADLENKDFDDVDTTARDALTRLGFYGDQYDCYVNHYQGYTWAELDKAGVQQHAETGGWTEFSWDQEQRTSSLDDKDWDELTQGQRDALWELCWFQQLWDQEQALDSWWQPTPSPTPQPSPLPAEAPNGDSEIEAVFPQERFVPWSQLTRKDEATNMGYTEETWNQPDAADFENLAFSDLTPEQRSSFTSITGTGEDSWDCWVNHYSGYDWDDLVDNDLLGYVTALGWTREMWQVDDYGAEGVPATDDKYWDDLTQDEQEAAIELCYTEELWDETNLEVWRGIAFPTVRYYRSWAELWDEARRQAAVVGWTQDTWNRPGTAEVEDLDWDQLTDDQRVALDYLDMYKANYDCYVNHYNGYSWDELETVGVRESFMVLGYTEKMWDSDGAEPPSYHQEWEDLTEGERNAAKLVCWFEEIWEEVPIPDWQDDAGDPVDEIGTKKSDMKSSSSSSNGKKAGRAVGITIGVLAAVAVVAVGIFVIIKKQGGIETEKESLASPTMPESAPDEENLQADEGIMT